jgi:hypothetical protein
MLTIFVVWPGAVVIIVSSKLMRSPECRRLQSVSSPSILVDQPSHDDARGLKLKKSAADTYPVGE